MANYSLSELNQEKTVKAKDNLREKIEWERRMSACAQIAAEKLNGQYITKRLDPQFQGMFPGSTRTYLYKRSYSEVIELCVYYEDMKDGVSIALCNADARRIDPEKLMKSAEEYARKADEHEAILARADSLIAAYNRIADRYAEIYDDISELFYEIPYADYGMQNKHKAARKAAAEKAAKKAAEKPSQDPNDTISFDDFVALMSAMA